MNEIDRILHRNGDGRYALSPAEGCLWPMAAIRLP